MDIFVYSDESGVLDKDHNEYYCDSSKTTLIRAADIVANRIFFNATHGKDSSTIPNIYITYLP